MLPWRGATHLHVPPQARARAISSGGRKLSRTGNKRLLQSLIIEFVPLRRRSSKIEGGPFSYTP